MPAVERTRTEHANATRIRELFAAFASRDVDAVRAAFSESAVWHFPGRQGQLAGSHVGLDAILGFLVNAMALTAGTFRLELEDVLANDAVAVVFFRGSGERNGRTLINPTCLKMRLDGSRIAEVWEFVWDLYDVDVFWT